MGYSLEALVLDLKCDLDNRHPGLGSCLGLNQKNLSVFGKVQGQAGAIGSAEHRRRVIRRSATTIPLR